MALNEPKYAGFSRRLLAHNIDLIPILVLLYGITFLIPPSSYDWILYSLIYFTYHIAFELSHWKATPGKRWCKIHVENERKENEALWAIIRNLTKIASLLMFFTGFVMILFNERCKGFHDYLAGTVVLFDEH